MKNIQLIALLLATLLTASSCEAKIKNAKTESHKVFGNCEMCKKHIEEAVFKSGEAKGDWNQDSKMLVLTFDSLKTDADIILKRVADVGYDNDKFVADNEVYKRLPQCCQYTRKELPEPVVAVTVTPPPSDTVSNPHANHEMTTSPPVKVTPNPTTVVKDPPKTTPTAPASPKVDVKGQIHALLTIYYQLADALVEANQKEAVAKASNFETVLKKVDMAAMTTKEHSFYMPFHEQMAEHIKQIKNASDIEGMRSHFDAFSNALYAVAKEFKANEGQAMYYDYCPMKKVYWISKEQGIKNPYYGHEMLTCGSVKETVK